MERVCRLELVGRNVSHIHHAMAVSIADRRASWSSDVERAGNEGAKGGRALGTRGLI